MSFCVGEKCVSGERLQSEDCRISSGVATGHAGEFLQGMLCLNGVERRFLVSIPAPELNSLAVFDQSSSETLEVQPGWKKKALQAFTLASLSLTGRQPTGTLRISSNIPVSRGLGSSTADCVAAIRAAASHAQQSITAAEIASLAHQAECYSDGTMFEDALVIFDHCNGRAIAAIDAAIPEFDILIAEEIANPTLIHTDEFVRPEYSAEEIRQFASLLSDLQQSLRQQDHQLLGKVAQASAAINQRYMEKPLLKQAEAIVREQGGIGVAIAHSGDVLILLFAHNALTEEMREGLSRKLQDVGLRIMPIQKLQKISLESCAATPQR